MSHWIDLQCRNKAILTHSGKSLDREISRISRLSPFALASRTCSPLGSPYITEWERRRNEAAAHKWGVEMIISRAPRGALFLSLACSVRSSAARPAARAALAQNRNELLEGAAGHGGSDTGCGTHSLFAWENRPQFCVAVFSLWFFFLRTIKNSNNNKKVHETRRRRQGGQGAKVAHKGCRTMAH